MSFWFKLFGARMQGKFFLYIRKSDYKMYQLKDAEKKLFIKTKENDKKTIKNFSYGKV